MLTELRLEFAGPEPRQLVEGALAAGFLPATPPTSMRIRGAKVNNPRPLAELVEGSDDVSVSWGEDAILHHSPARDHLMLHRSQCEVSPERLVALLRDLPFEDCITSTVDPTWWQGHNSIHGWAFALKGAGHRLVSPRVIDRGPWRLHRDGDLTVFQFHDLGADEATALAQAAPGHALLAPMWLGGHYAGQSWAFRSNASGYRPTFYERATRTSVILVQEREVTPHELGIAAGTCIHQIFDEPVHHVRFVYMDEAEAQRNLPAHWRYGHEVRAMTAAGERRLDTGYVPPPFTAPAWSRT